MFGKILITLAFTTVFTYSQSPQESQPETPVAEEQPGGSFHWLKADGPMKGEKLGKHQLESLELETEFGAFFELEEEFTQVDAETTRRTIRAYRLNGARRSLYQVIEEEVKNSSDGGIKAVRTTSTADLNGKLNVSRKVLQETVPAGQDVFETRMTVEMPDPNRRLVPIERIEQTERLLEDESVSIERVEYSPTSGGKWETLEKRVATSREVDGVIQTEEQVFRLDGNRRLALNQESSSQEWEAGDGTLFRTTEERRPNFDGKMEVVQQRQIEQRAFEDGTVQTVEQVAARSMGAQTKELALLKRITQEASSGSAGTELSISVEALDNTGRFGPVSTYRVLTSESSGKKKTTVK
jgi:hypothetical protein